MNWPPVEALLRRPRAGEPRAEVYDDGRLLVRLTAREVSVGGTPLALTPMRVDQLIAMATALIGRGRQRWAEPYPDSPGHDTLPT